MQLPRRRVHGGFNRSQIVLNIFEHPALDRPAKEVELAHGGLKKGVAGNLKHDALTPTEGVEQLLGIGLQLGLVVVVDQDLLAGQNIGDVVLLCIVCDKPVYESEGEGGCAEKNRENLVDVCALRIEALETVYNEFLLAMDLSTASLGIGIKTNHVSWACDFGHLFIEENCDNCLGVL